ncbi:MAG TPA: OmpA family protein [Candidatus Acidoferrum sp.]|nr:OmpA family protein [Candidatus Acidoferrum sp.]
MKNSTFFALGTALVLASTVGCRHTPPRTSPLPGGANSDSDAGRRGRDLSTTPFGQTGGASATSAALAGDLPDDAKLADRDQDRSRFSAETVYFDFDRADVRAAQAGNIDKVASAFKSLPPGHDLLIEGHCDERGTEGYNQSLGERRALAIRELLIKTGVDAQHVFTKSLGKDQPALTGHDEPSWSKNRRGEFILVLPKKITTTQNSQ